jgi:hypothetical protein
MITRNGFSVGQKVYFGRRQGERTLGRIVKRNPNRAKVEQLEERGKVKSHAVGTVWTVPYGLLSPVAADTPATPSGGGYTPPPVNPAAGEPTRQRMIDAAQRVLGLPILFRRGEIQWADHYQVELVLPSGFRIDLGSALFGADGKLQPSSRATTPALDAVVAALPAEDVQK